MPRTYITQTEAYVLSFIKGGKFQAEHRQQIHDQVTPRLIGDLLKDYDALDAAAILQYVIERIDLRYEKAKDRRYRYELGCYRSWLANAQAQIMEGK